MHPAQGSGGSCVDVGGGVPSVVGGVIWLARRWTLMLRLRPRTPHLAYPALAPRTPRDCKSNFQCSPSISAPAKGRPCGGSYAAAETCAESRRRARVGIQEFIVTNGLAGQVRAPIDPTGHKWARDSARVSCAGAWLHPAFTSATVCRPQPTTHYFSSTSSKKDARHGSTR